MRSRRADLPSDKELAPTRESLLERLRDHTDQRSWQEFFDTYWKLLYCAAIKGGLSDSEAEDVVQETIVSVVRGLENFHYDPHRCSFKGWLMVLTRHRIVDHIRKRRIRPERLVPWADPGDTHVGDEIADPAAETAFEQMWNEEWERNLMDAALERIKTRVSPQHYQIFYLRTVKDLPAGRISELLNVSLAKVYVVHHRMARLLRREVRTLMRCGLPLPRKLSS